MSSPLDFAPPIIYEVGIIGTGKLSIMAMPASSGQFAELRRQGVDHVVSLLDVDEQVEVETLQCERLIKLKMDEMVELEQIDYSL